MSIEAKIARYLIEGPDTDENEAKTVNKVKIFADRLLLRLLSAPSLPTYLADFAIVNNPEKRDGSIIQLDFHRLPEEVILQLDKLIAAPHKPEYYKYVKDGSSRTGIELHVSPEDFPGSDYDYAA